VKEDFLRILSFHMCRCCSSGQKEKDDIRAQETRRQWDCIDKEPRVPNKFHRREQTENMLALAAATVLTVRKAST
jgi:hypothetical protein